MPGVELRRVGLDYFTLVATKPEIGDLAEQLRFYNSDPFRYSLMTYSAQEIRQYYHDRIDGFYYNDFYERYLSEL